MVEAQGATSAVATAEGGQLGAAVETAGMTVLAKVEVVKRAMHLPYSNGTKSTRQHRRTRD